MRYTVVMMKKQKKPKPGENPALVQELPQRLTELEAELRRHAARRAEDRPLQSVNSVSDVVIGSDKAVQFSISKKVYAAGHADSTYARSNHPRGGRPIPFYEA